MVLVMHLRVGCGLSAAVSAATTIPRVVRQYRAVTGGLPSTLLQGIADQQGGELLQLRPVELQVLQPEVQPQDDVQPEAPKRDDGRSEGM